MRGMRSYLLLSLLAAAGLCGAIYCLADVFPAAVELPAGAGVVSNPAPNGVADKPGAKIGNVSKSSEELRTIWSNGGAPITIDGASEDWSGIAAPKFELKTPYPGRTTRLELPPPGDLSAAFSCFADANRLYVRVDVTDDRLVFGRQSFQDIWADDSVVIAYAGDFPKTGVLQLYGEHDGRIVVSQDSSGRAITSDWSPLGDGSWEAKPQFQKLPGFWEALGVESAIAANSSGYVVEVAIPFEVLGWQEGQKPDQLGINVKVFDNDSGNGLGENVIGWTSDPRNSSLDSSRCFRGIGFEEIKGGGKAAKAKKASHYSEFKRAIENLRKKDWFHARWALWESPPESASYALMAKIETRSTRLRYRHNTLERALEGCKEPHLAGWFIENLAQVRLERRQFSIARELYERLDKLGFSEAAKRAQAGLVAVAWAEGGEAAATRLLESEEKKSPQALLALATRLQAGPDPSKALPYLRQVADQPGVFVTHQTDALLNLQRIHMRLKDFDSADAVALEHQVVGEDTSIARVASLDLLRLSKTIRRKRLHQQVGSLADEYAAALGRRAWVGPLQTLELGQLLLDAGRFDEATERFQQALDMPLADDQERARALLGLGLVCVRKGDSDGALKLAETLQTSYPNQLEARVASLGLLRWLSAENAQSADPGKSAAIRDRLKAHLTALSRHERGTEAGYASHFLGCALLAEGRVAEAEAQFRACVERFPESKTFGMTLALLAGILETQERWLEAMPVREKLAEVKDERTRESLGAVNLRMLADLYVKSPDHKGGFSRCLGRIAVEYPDSLIALAMRNGLPSSPIAAQKGGAR